jgi:hypothetical protein
MMNLAIIVHKTVQELYLNLRLLEIYFLTIIRCDMGKTFLWLTSSWYFMFNSFKLNTVNTND